MANWSQATTRRRPRTRHQEHISMSLNNNNEQEAAVVEAAAGEVAAATSEDYPSSKSRAPRRTWEEGYADLRAFFEEHGHSRAKATTLVGRWARNQRKKRDRGELSEEQIRQLDDIHHDWEHLSEKLEKHWQHMWKLLRRFKVENGHTRVPQQESYKGESLGNWVTSQQSLYRTEKLKPWRKEQLDELGFEWIRDERLVWKDTRPLGKLDDDWKEKFGILCDYKNQHGDTLVPIDHMAKLENGVEFCLGAFACRHRQLHRDGLLRKERKDKLKSIGFIFAIDIYDAETSKNQKAWDEMFDRLSRYEEEHGDCNIPAASVDDPELGFWTRTQRALYRQGALGQIRLDRLEALGFSWTPLEEQWNEMVNLLRGYKLEHGDCKVPDAYQTKDGANLGSWVRTVRAARHGTRDTELSAERIAQLDALGFIWDNVLHLHWDIMYDALKKYQEKNGHCRVPQSYKGDSVNLPRGLGSWVSLQRTSLEEKLEKTGNPMYVERRKKLNAIGFDWSLAHIPQENWDAMFESLKQYKEKYGDCRVPYSYGKDSGDLPRKLGPWIYDQRHNIPPKVEEGNPTFIERKRRLDQIEFLWEDNASHSNWMKMFETLEEYKSQHGHCRVPKSYHHENEDLPAKLDNWVSVQKSTVPAKADNGHPMYVERKSLLDSIGFEFDNVFEAKWENMFERLKKYHSANGNCRVPANFMDENGSVSLSAWANMQRRTMLDKASRGEPKYVERKRLLDTLQFEYDKVDEAKWMTMFHILKKFAEEHGHCNVPLSYGRYNNDAPTRGLGSWCYDQRKNVPAGLENDNAANDYKERKRLLESVGFEWVVQSEKEEKWNTFFERLKTFKEIHGHTRVPPDFGSEESSLYSWVRNQHSKLLTKLESGDPMYVERKRRLDAMGFEWTRILDKKWEQMFQSLVEYKNAHGHCRVPYRGNGAIDGPSGNLGIWVYGQRTKVPKKASEGDPVCIDRKHRLDSIGFEWLDVNASKWEVMFAGLERFHQAQGHSRVKRDYKDLDQPLPANLGSWMSIQRRQIPELVEQGDEVAMERKERLDALGFVWKTRAPPKAYERNGKVIHGRSQSSSTNLSNVETTRDQQTGTLRTKRNVVRPDSRTRCNDVESPLDGALTAASTTSSRAAPGPDGTLVSFPDYDGISEPVMWKKAFRQFRRRLRNVVKESLDSSERTKERVKQVLETRWSQLAEEEKEKYRKWAVWDKMRYESDVAMQEQLVAARVASRKRKLSRESSDYQSSSPKKKKKKGKKKKKKKGA